MFWRQESVRLKFNAREPLRSAADNLYFVAHIEGKCRPGRRRHEDFTTLAKTDIRKVARVIARNWEADQWYAAQDEINAQLGVPFDCTTGHYKDRVAQITLIPDKDTILAASRNRDSRARVASLEYLKSALYTDPALLAIAYLEKNPDQLSNVDFEQFRRFADRVVAGEKRWAPLMIAWSELASKADSPDAVNESMQVLLESIHRLDAKLARRYNLPAWNEQEVSSEHSTNGEKS